MIERLLNIKKYISAGKVMVLFGPRRSGKTTLLKSFLADAKNETVLFLNGDRYDVRNRLLPENFADFELSLKGLDILAIDEAQNIPRIGETLKLIIDEYPNIAIIATGSSSFDLREQIGEPLVGRKSTNILYPFSILELKNWRLTAEILENTIIYGFYPNSIIAKSDSDREEFLYELVDSLLLKDILSYKDIKSPEVIYNLLKLLAYQIGNEVSTNELSNKLGIHKDTVNRYLDLLEKSFVIIKIFGFSANLRNEVTKKPKYYFQDVGVRNAIIRDFTPIGQRKDKGALFENWAIMERVKRNSYAKYNAELKFWRNYQGNEIDLVEIKDAKLSLYEFKYSSTNAKVPKQFAKNVKFETFDVIYKDNVFEWLTSF
ncbi:MAG: ATP-binding protein [Bifidobacteriaceae bacterium]|jgi:predicted AAA+ superfamily ATPase|nr:ATP-binding protein [Bifidobacteriaceae bacterium]